MSWAKIDLVNAVERGLYAATIERVKNEARPEVTLDGAPYRLRDFSSQGFDFQLLGYDWFLGVHDVLYNQYEQGDVRLNPDDVIIDAGAFIGDTAVFFHHKLGGRCQIHSFELLDENLALLVHNLERNGVADEQIVVNKLALTDKMGAEVLALTRARQPLQHFKPKLAICLYHKWDDAFTIPQVIHATGVDYAFSFKWVQLSDDWEAVLLATPAAQVASAAPPPVVATASDSLADALGTLTRAYVKKWGQADTLWRQKQRVPAPGLAFGESA